MIDLDLERLFARVRAGQDAGTIPTKMTEEARLDWAFGNAVLANPNVTRAMVADALRRKREL